MIHIIGIGYKPLQPKAKGLLQDAKYIVTSPRLKDVFDSYDIAQDVQHRLAVIVSVDETIAFVKSHLDEDIALLASGDPLFHGIARRVIKECGAGNVEIYPEISCLQAAFCKIKEPWDDAFLISLHGGLVNSKHRSYTPEDLPALILKHPKIGILTDPKNNPSVIAKALTGYSFSDCLTIHVCQRIGYDDEEILSGAPVKMANRQFKDPNVVIVVRKGDNCIPEGNRRSACLLGLQEPDIVHKEGLITKDEVRAVIMHKLRVPETGIMWDIGAGSGAVSLEVANMSKGLRVYAVERDINQCSIIRENIDLFNLHNITLIEGTAPEALESLPCPDRVFIGGSNGKLEKIMDRVMQKAGDKIVIILSASMVETLHEALRVFSIYKLAIDCSQIAVSRLTALPRGNYFKSLNPIFIVRAER